MQTPSDLPACPLPLERYPAVVMGHGGGGRLMRELLQSLVFEALGAGSGGHDAAVVDMEGGRMAFTTDSFVVRPRIFPGGDIGALAVHGTVNDLAMAGARPRWLSVSLIIEEGLAMDELWRLLLSLRRAADEAGVTVVTGDTKVVDRGAGDGLFINTAGIGTVAPGVDIRPGRVGEGDAVLVSGDLGRHGIAVMAERESLAFESAIESDSANLAPAVAALLEAGLDIHCLRDLTRGGLSSALNEIAADAGRGILIDEAAVPVREDVAAACEVLGLDPLYVACEGRFAVFLPEDQAGRALEILTAYTPEAAIVGRVDAGRPGRVRLTSRIGAERVLDMLSGEQLPRIC
ncbi:hydrogenase expression/formation protein HypE [Ectothiorhodospiraceae bacterium WFHF3C12]|nr:hydrogenase expression/formation protein HypE [Ectothiorhodospiraceae bacterium WFHF3C12]